MLGIVWPGSAKLPKPGCALVGDEPLTVAVLTSPTAHWDWWLLKQGREQLCQMSDGDGERLAEKLAFASYSWSIDT